MSNKDIDPGNDWFNEVRKLLDETDYAVFCVTPSSRTQWMCFEAGYLTHRSTTFTALLFGLDSGMLRESFPPLADSRSQAVHFVSSDSNQPDLEMIRNLVFRINECAAKKHKDDSNLYFDNTVLGQAVNDQYPAYGAKIRNLMVPYTIADLNQDVQDLRSNLDGLREDDFHGVRKAVEGLDEAVSTCFRRERPGTLREARAGLDQVESSLTNVRKMLGYVAEKTGSQNPRLGQIIKKLDKFAF